MNHYGLGGTHKLVVLTLKKKNYFCVLSFPYLRANPWWSFYQFSVKPWINLFYQCDIISFCGRFKPASWILKHMFMKNKPTLSLSIWLYVLLENTSTSISEQILLFRDGWYRISCLLHYIHYLYIPLRTNSWDDIVILTKTFKRNKFWSTCPLFLDRVLSSLFNYTIPFNS